MQTGMGVDLHGSDNTSAACRAVKNAIQGNNMLFLKHIGLKSFDDLIIDVILACPDPDKIDKDEVASQLPIGQVNVITQTGGMLVDSDQSGDPVLAVIAAVQVGIK